jgi:phosphoribosylanthranilate isomerase
VTAAVAATRPFAVDVASGVEAEPGRKDPAKLEAFLSTALAVVVP